MVCIDEQLWYIVIIIGKAVNQLTIILGILAATIMFFYSFYFVKIITGQPEGFELELLQSLGQWMIRRGTRSYRDLWLLLVLSGLLELTYFLVVFLVIDNFIILMITWFFLGFELLHLFNVSLSLGRFFRGGIKLKHLFNWRLERISALLFFTYSLLVLISIILY